MIRRRERDASARGLDFGAVSINGARAALSYILMLDCDGAISAVY